MGIICRIAEVFDCQRPLIEALELRELQLHNAEIKQSTTSHKLEVTEGRLSESVLNNLKLNEELERIKNLEINPTVVPEKSITYSRRMYFEKKWYNKPISIRNFFSVNDDTYKDQLKAKDLFIKDEEELESNVPDIYKLAKKNYKYVYDSDHGFSEYWLFPWELDESIKLGIGGDCEDYSHKITTMLRLAGVPANRVFTSCGTTRSGFGHSTVYVRDDLLVWRHLNSTKPHYNRTELSAYPAKNDERDKIGIGNGKFWFSANDKISISKFETEEAESLFNAETVMQKVGIQ